MSPRIRFTNTADAARYIVAGLIVILAALAYALTLPVHLP